MADGILGQVAADGTDQVAYAVPASKKTTCSSLVVCNRGSTEQRFRVAILPASDVAGGIQPKHYNYYDLPVEANDTFAATLGFRFAAGDKVYVRGDSANLSFSLYGIEEDA